jgi:hypothetical protein
MELEDSMLTVKELKENFVATDLERRLKNDKSGAVLGEIEDQLTLCIEEVDAAKKAGLSPNEYYRADRLLPSLRVSHQVVRRTWNHFHTR